MPPVRVQIVLPLPLEQALTYLWPDAMPCPPAVGLRVLVPLGKRRISGYVLASDQDAQIPRTRSGQETVLKEVLSLLDEDPLFGERELRFYRWIAQYYLSPLGEVLKTALPISMQLRSYRGVRRTSRKTARTAWEEEMLETREREILDHLASSGKLTLKELGRRVSGPLDRWIQSLEEKGLVERCQIFKGKQGRKVPEKAEPGFPDAPALETLPPSGTGPEQARTLSEQQQSAVHKILPALSTGSFHSFLIHGVTGSGKTEVYIRIIERALSLGRSALVLVPEIGLTPQTVRQFAARFDTPIEVLHSRLTDKERLDSWWRIRLGQVKIAIGARSAIFAPFENLGVIVVDEEHDGSYKQQDRVRYNGRDLALVRGLQEKAVVILGSATPSLESYHNVEKGKSTLIELTERIHGIPLPGVQKIDLRHPSTKRARGAISRTLERALKENERAGKKSLLFLNRRGYAPTLTCAQCGERVQCPHCSVSLTFHRARNRLCCHYCDYLVPVPPQCPKCQAGPMQPTGRGTERLEEDLKAVMPGARVGRMDRDTTRRKGSHEEILDRFHGDGLNVLVGTQMVAKGHDVHRVTLVGVIMADVSLDLPDFRASERTFQLLMQVAGRAGRGKWPGRVLIQTYHPEHYSIEAASRHDYRAFYDREIAFRKELNYPPFCRMVNLRVSGADESLTREAAERVGALAKSLVNREVKKHPDLEVLGPSNAPLARLRGKYRFHCFLKGNPPNVLLHISRQVLALSKPFMTSGKVQLEVDVDPMQVL